MALFGKKKKTEPCPVCGKEMDAGLLGNSMAVKDGIICGACEQMLRGTYDIQHYVERGFFTPDYKEKTEDPLHAMTVAMIKELVEEAKEKQAEAIKELGSQYSALMTADNVMMITPKAKDVGMKRAKQLQNKLVARGMIQLGTFAKGDPVVVIHDDSEKETTLLDVIPCGTGSDFNTELNANMHKKEAPQNTNAWLILDTEGGVKNGDMIAKR